MTDTSTVSSSTEFLYIPPIQGSWTLFLSPFDRPHHARLLEGFLDNGARRDADGWDAFSFYAYRGGRSYHLSAPDFTAFLGEAYELRTDSRHGKSIEQMRGKIQDFTRANYFQFASRLLVKPKDKSEELDRVVHHKGLPIESCLQIDALDIGQLAQGLFGAGLDELRELYGWLNGTSAHVNQLIERADFKIDSVARFVAGSVRASLDCNGNPRDSGHGLGGSFA